MSVNINNNGTLERVASEDTEQIADIVNVYGSKNLLPSNVLPTQTVQGITFTAFNDGHMTISGSNTGGTTKWFWINGANEDTVLLKKGSYRLNANSIGVSEACRFSIMSGGTYISVINGDGQDKSFTLNTDTYVRYGIRVDSTATDLDVTIKPMLRLASIEDDTYVPYVPTNAKLDEEKVSYDDANESVQKNLLPVSDVANSTQVGITLTNNQDGTYTLSGTCTASGNYLKIIFTLDGYDGYILNGAPSGSATNTYHLRVRYIVSLSDTTYVGEGIDTGNGVKIEYPTGSTAFQIQLVVATKSAISNLTFKPMLRKATIKDDTWTPYIPNNTELTTWKANGVLGAKNLIPYPYTDTTKTVSGITFTDNGDGTVTVNGTSTAVVRFYFTSYLGNFDVDHKSAYILSDNVNATLSTFYTSCALYNDSTYTNIVYATFSNRGSVRINLKEVSATWNKLQIYIIIKNGVTVSNVTFKPMLRLAEDTDDTYQPYAMTNRELTEDIKAIECDKTTAGTYTLQCVVDSSGNKTYSWV